MKMTKRERDVAKARAILGDERLIAFLRGCKEHGLLACKMINKELEGGKSLDAIFYTGDRFGYCLEVKKTRSNEFIVSFGCRADPEAGDGGEWTVFFASDGKIQIIESVEFWIS
jgi:hypothetical protein